jgi:hypothetical protein
MRVRVTVLQRGRGPRIGVAGAVNTIDAIKLVRLAAPALSVLDAKQFIEQALAEDSGAVIRIAPEDFDDFTLAMSMSGFAVQTA